MKRGRNRAFAGIGLACLAIVMAAAFYTRSSFAEGDVEYMVIFKPMWTAKTHPLEYPKGNIITGAHFSGTIGATHNGEWRIFKEGMMPSSGLEKLSETGKPSPLDAEIMAAIETGNAGMLVQLDAVKDLSKTSSGKFRATMKHPMVSLVTMIAPSPDWFAGADSVSLWEGGKWVATKSVDLFAWDSGGDDGTTYKASDMDNDPKKPTMMANSSHFVMKGKKVRVGTLTFKKQ